MAKMYRPYFEEGSIKQKRLSREDALKVYKQRGGDEAFFSFFYMRYDDAYDSYKSWEMASDRSLRDAFNMTRWYAFYKRIGHSDNWCLIAMMYNCPDLDWNHFNLESDPEDYVDKEISFENDMECLKLCMDKYPDEKEYQLHRSYYESIGTNAELIF